MGLNDIQLSAAQVIDFYGRHLLADSENASPAPPRAADPGPVKAAQPSTPVAEPARPAAQPPAPKPLQYLGKNQKKTAIFVHYPKEVYVPEAELNFLTSILQACRLNLGDVAIVNHAHHPLPPADLCNQLQSRYLLVFGVSLTDPALRTLPPFTPLEQNGCNIVLAPPLDQLNNNSPEGKLLKTKLWVCLKQLFNV